jgi:CAAX prenyl protease-like protein
MRRRGPFHVVAWGLVIFAGIRSLELLLEAPSMMVVVGQAVLAEWGASRLDVSWSAPPDAPPATIGPSGGRSVIAKRAALGAAFGLGAAAALFVVLLARHAILVERVHVEASTLALGLATASLHAMRDELLLHGVTLRALADTRTALPKVIACGATSAGAAMGVAGASVASVLAQALLGIGLGALWVQDRGAWRPWAAHAAWLFGTGTLLHGGIVESKILSTVAGHAEAAGESGLFGGSAAVVALLPFAVAAIAWAARRSSPAA